MSFEFVCDKYPTVEAFLENCELETKGRSRDVVEKTSGDRVEFGFVLNQCKVTSLPGEFPKLSLTVDAAVKQALRQFHSKLFIECEPLVNGLIFGCKVDEDDCMTIRSVFPKGSFVKVRVMFNKVSTFHGTLYPSFVLDKIAAVEAPVKSSSVLDW